MWSCGEIDVESGIATLRGMIHSNNACVCRDASV